MAPICITGVPDTGVHPRREIHELVADHRQFSLFVLALLHMQEMDSEDPTSYYALAGIHGYPYQPWPASPSRSRDADTETARNKTQWLGYCTHGTVLFPTWHRPYILALEQHLQAHATHLASLYTTPDAPSWRLAARTLRMPYWDWALHPLPPPEVIEYETVWVTKCKGKREEVRNPLFSFVFPEGVRGEGFPKRFRRWGRTVRWPMSCEEGGKSDVEALKRALSGHNAQQTQAAVYRMLVNVHTWIEFSNHNAPSCSCSCISATSVASASSHPPSPSQPATTSPSRSDPQHHTTTIKCLDDDDEHADNEQCIKKRNCHCRNSPETSLEGIHDTLHNLLGGGGEAGKGHMGSPAVAAFDSIFYLHHTNVDRLLAIWARLNPRAWVARSDHDEDQGDGSGGGGGEKEEGGRGSEEQSGEMTGEKRRGDKKGRGGDNKGAGSKGGGWSRRGTWSVPRGAWIDARTELTPFGRTVEVDDEVDEGNGCKVENRNAEDDNHEHNKTEGRRKTRCRYWTSEDVRDTESFGYTYPELQDLHVNSSDDYPRRGETDTENLDKERVREELERRVCVMYGRGVEGLFAVAGNEQERDHEEERDGASDEVDGEESERDYEGQEEAVDEGVILSGDVDPQPHLAPLPLPSPRPRLHSTPSASTPMRPKEKSTAQHALAGNAASLGVAANNNEARVWVWDWKVRVRVREFEVGGGESVEVRVFLVPTSELYEDNCGEEPVLRGPGRRSSRDQAGRLQGVSSTSTPLPPQSTYPPASSSSGNTSTASTPPTNTTQPTITSKPSEVWDYDYNHSGYVGCVGTFVNELETAEMCGNCSARRRIGLSGERQEASEDGGEEEEGRESSVVQGTVYLSERIVEEMHKDFAIEEGDGERQRMKGLELSVVLPFLRERLRWGVWTVANNAPIPFASLAPGAVEVDVCATRMSLPTSSLCGKGERRARGGGLPDVGETVWYTL